MPKARDPPPGGRGGGDARASTELLDRKPRQLSGGQRQRVAMGRAIVREPAAFLMDEPLSNLDAKLRVEMRGEIIRVQRRIAAPTLYVTHDQTEAMTMGDRVAILRDGVLQQLGTPDEVYDRPVNVFVAGFIGSPSMNLVSARWSGRATGWRAFAGARSRCRQTRLDLARAADARREPVTVGIRPEDFGAGGRGAARPSTVDPAGVAGLGAGRLPDAGRGERAAADGAARPQARAGGGRAGAGVGGRASGSTSSTPETGEARIPRYVTSRLTISCGR